MSDWVFESYGGLWGELMFVMHDPDHLRAVNRGRADWFASLDLPGWRVLDLGAGNGYFDLELGRRGYRVVAVDQVRPVVEAARLLRRDESVDFIVSDLRDLAFEAGSVDAVTMFGVVGLMSIGDDTSLLAECFTWLTPGGSLLVDCDINLAKTETIEAKHELGVIQWHWTSDAKTRTNMLTPELHRDDGVTVRLKDPIDPGRGDHEGLHRYIYPKRELIEILTSIGFQVIEVGHYVQHVFPDSQAVAYMLQANRP